MPKPEIKYLCSCEQPADLLFRPHESVRAPGIQPMYAACHEHAQRAIMYLGQIKVLRVDVVSPE